MRLKRFIPIRLKGGYERASAIAKRSMEMIGRQIDHRSLGIIELESILHEAGIRSGAVVLLHSSQDQVTRRVSDATPFRLIAMMIKMLGKDGTLMMPTFPFDGEQAAYLDQTRCFDPHRTPSRSGLLTELFRRTRGVLRSKHPTHSIAAYGRHAEELLADHHLGDAFGELSPFQKMADLGGVVLSLGIKPEKSFTHFHVCEVQHEPTRLKQFETAPIKMTILDQNGDEDYELIVHRRGLNRDYSRVVKTLTREGILSCESHSGLIVGYASAKELIVRGTELLELGKFY